jgi:filamentous hemagglutinin family protein
MNAANTPDSGDFPGTTTCLCWRVPANAGARAFARSSTMGIRIMSASRRTPRRGRLATSLAIALLASAGAAPALAGDGTVVAGSATIARDAQGNTSIVQGTSRAIIDWNDFSVGAGQWMRFLQPGADAAVLNRVLGGNPSAILGELSGNGRIFVINPNGLVVGPDGVIQAGAFVASTLDVDNASFMAGGALRFAGNSAAAIRNLGFIRAASGDVVLVARSVDNAGAIEAANGTAALAAGNDVLLQPTGDQRMVVRAGIAGGGTGASNEGTIRAAQAQLAAAGGNVYALAINAGGSIEATGLASVDGRIVLTSDGGDIAVDGTLRARDADGSGGTILVGGDAHGASPAVANAASTTVAAGAVLDADASAADGDGGKIVVWSNGDTAFAGTILARGGTGGGDGGFAEVSGKRLAMDGFADLRAAHGMAGTLLLDPDDIVVDTDAAANGSAGGVTTLTDEWINSQLLLGALSVQTDAGASGGNGDIIFRGNSAFTTSMPNALSFDAARDIVFDTGFNIVASFDGSDGNNATVMATTGDLSFLAGRDILLNQAFSASYTANGGDGDSADNAGENLYVTLGRIAFDAGRDVAINADVGIAATANGGAGGSAGGGAIGGAGGYALMFPGMGTAFGFTAGNDILVGAGATIGRTVTANGGEGGAAMGGPAGTGGIATATGLKYTFTAGNRFTLADGARLSSVASGTAGASGEGDSLGTGAMGAVGNATGGSFTINADEAWLLGNVDFAATSTGGAAAHIGASGSPGGVVSASTLSVLSSGDILLGGSQGSTLLQLPGMDAVGPLGGTGGPGGSISGGGFEFHARGDITTAAGGLQLDSADIVLLEAGHSILLDDSALHAGSAFIPLLLIADNANPTRPDSGDGAIRLSGTTLGGTAGVSLWGVSNALVDLGGWDPGSYGTTTEWRGESGNWMALGLHCKFICTAPPAVSPLTITADDKSMTYGAGAFPEFTASYSGFLAGDDASDVSGLQFSTTATLGANVGSYAIHPFGASVPGYVIGYVDGVLAITPAALTIGVADASRSYGQKNPQFVLQVSGLVNGDSAGDVFSAGPATTAAIGSNVGSYAISPNASLLSGNYVLTQFDGVLTIVPAELLVSLVAGDVVRGDEAQVLMSSHTVAAGAHGESMSGTSTYTSQFGTTDIFQWLVSGFAAGDNALSGAPVITGDGMQSAYAIALGSLAASPNYVFRFRQPSGTGWLTVHNPLLTVSLADLYAMTQGLDISPRYVFSGFRGNDTQWENLDLHDGRFGWTTTAQSGGDGGDYPITPTGPRTFAPRGGAYGPYDVAYNGGTLHVLNRDGGVPRSASCTGKGCGTTVAIQLLVENGTQRRQALYNFAMVPKIFGLPANFTRQLNDIVGMYLRSIGQAGDAASANNWLLANASNPDAYGRILPFVLQWMETYEREAFLQRVLSDAEKYLTGDQRYSTVWQSLTPYLTGMEIGALAYPTPDALRAVVARLRGEHPAPTEADLALYDYIATDLQNKRIAAADAAVQAYKEWKAESAKKKEEKLPTLLGLFDLGESPPQELMTAAKTGASPEGADPAVMAQVLGAAAATWAGATVGGLTAANLTSISAGIAGAVARGATLTTSMVGGAAAGPAIIVTAALQIAVQGIIKVVSDAEFEKKLYEAADDARQNWSVTSLMNTDEKTGGSAELAIGTATNLAALLAGGTTPGAVSTVSTNVGPLPGGGFLIVDPVPTIDPSQIVTLPPNIIMQGDKQ